jgi:hypothetical protein
VGLNSPKSLNLTNVYPNNSKNNKNNKNNNKVKSKPSRVKIREMAEPRCYFSSDQFYLAEFLDLDQS